MGADQIAAIRPALSELVQAADNNEPDADNLCATFTVPERPEVWVQVQLGMINTFYPRSEEPLAFLHGAHIPPLAGLAIESWKAKAYATFTHEPCSLHSIAQFVDRLLIALHALHAEEYPIDVEFERLEP